MNQLYDLLLKPPLPENVVQFLLFLTFTMHLLFVLILLGTAILSMFYFISAWWGPVDRVTELKWDKIILRKFLPIKALAVILGVAPLLLFQVTYSIPFLTATSFHAEYWMLVIAFLIFALFSFDILGQKMEVHGTIHLVVGLLGLVFLFAVPGIFAAIVITAENPDQWVHLARNTGRFSGILSLHWIARYFHILGAAIVIGSIFHFIFSAHGEHDKRRLLRWFIAGSLLQIPGGFALYLSLPAKMPAITYIPLGAAILLLIIVLGSVFAALLRNRLPNQWALGVLTMVLLTSMLITRQIIQNQTLVPLNQALRQNAQQASEGLEPFRPAALELYTGFLKETMDNGKSIYARSCAFCHGIHGDGKGPAAKQLEIAPEVLSAIRADKTYIYGILLNGVQGSGMPTFRYYDLYKLQSLMEFLNTEFKTLEKPQPNENSSDPELIQSAENIWENTCAVCHGLKGKGTLLGLKFRPPVPDLTLYGLTSEHGFKVITEGYQRTMMPAFYQLPEQIRTQLANFVIELRLKAAKEN